MKKALSLALALVMCLGLTVPAFAEGDFDTNGGTLRKYKGAGGDVVVPDGITTISSYAFSASKTVTGVTLPDTVTIIQNYAFQSCGALRRVTLSNSLTSIKYGAFTNCSALESVVIPDSVIEIGGIAFSSCSSLKSVTLSQNLVSLGDWAFSDCNSLTTIAVPGTVASIGTYAFHGCTSLKTATLYDGVTGIGKDAFRGCPSLTSVTIPASVTAIGMAAFYDSKSLKDVYYGGSEEQWKTIKINTLNGPLTEATIHYNSPMPTAIPASGTAYASTQSVLVDGKAVEFEMYALRNEAGNMTNYIKLRDLAKILDGTVVQFQVGWNGAVNIETGKGYTPNGSEMKTPFSGSRSYERATAATNVNGAPAELTAFILKDDNGSGYTYYQLRDLGKVLGFYVGWTAADGVIIDTGRAYTE